MSGASAQFGIGLKSLVWILLSTRTVTRVAQALTNANNNKRECPGYQIVIACLFSIALRGTTRAGVGIGDQLKSRSRWDRTMDEMRTPPHTSGPSTLVNVGGSIPSLDCAFWYR